MAINTTTGSKLYIGTNATIDYTSDSSAIADFEAEEWIEVGNIENLGPVGDRFNDVTASDLATGRIKHFKGAADAGVQEVTCFNNPEDEGQVAMVAASRTQFAYNFKVELQDAPSELYSNTIGYYRGPVMGRQIQVGTNDQMLRRSFSIGVTEELIEIPAALLSP